LGQLAEADRRSMSQQVIWMVEHAWMARQSFDRLRQLDKEEA
jgi:hypothetical protein